MLGELLELQMIVLKPTDLNLNWCHSFWQWLFFKLGLLDCIITVKMLSNLWPRLFRYKIVLMYLGLFSCSFKQKCTTVFSNSSITVQGR